MGIVDSLIGHEVTFANKRLSETLNSDIILYNGPMTQETPHIFNDMISNTNDKKRTLSIVLTTSGGIVEAVERAVNLIRNAYRFVNFIVPDYAMSAGTVFCMSGDKIFMSGISSLGPIDPQVQSINGTFVPAMGYLEQFEKLIEKSKDNTISPAEIDMLRRLDLAEINRYEQARELTVTLLKKWLVNYKFKTWKTHKTNNIGTSVTLEEKMKRAEDIAKQLGDIKKWHSHGRYICIDTLRSELNLKIEDYTKREDLQRNILVYHQLTSDYMAKNRFNFYVHSKNQIFTA